MNVEELDKLFVDLGIDKKEFYNIERLVDEYAEYIEKIGDKKITFGYSITDDLIRGLRTQEVLTVIAQTGIGKSALALNLLQNYVKSSNELTVLFSLEMSSVGIAERIFQIELDVFGYEVEKKFKNKEQQFIQDCKNLQSSLNNLIIVVKRIDVHRIPDYIKIIEAIRNKKVSLVCIDYVGLMENKSFITDEYGRLTDNMRRIYAYAKELNVAVINLSQVSRADLKAKESLSLFSGKGSGEIENSSDFVLALEKLKPGDEKYEEYKNIQVELEERKISLLKLTILKNRRGQIASVIITFNRKNLQIKEYSKMKQEEFEQQRF